tara:strand:- start:240 stop:395 length:156 start_codon:yes stop_codon:yes gene_type:complete
MPYKGLDETDIAVCVASIENAQFKGVDVIQISETLTKLRTLLEKELKKDGG